ncbi:MAG: hypothetical protein HZA49_03720 [Planctomycetes bacterium]|nr:hypothetical protein [Planctomycetota bacterium]
MFYRFNYIIVCTVITVMLGIWIYSLSFTTPKNTMGTLEIPLPKDEGMQPTSVVDPILDEIRVLYGMGYRRRQDQTKNRVKYSEKF